MTTQVTMSLFSPPIAPIRDAQGRITTPATLVPACEISIEQLHQLIVGNKKLEELTRQVRQASDIRLAKTTLLPYVTPCGTFSRRNSSSFKQPSGVVVVDVDHLSSTQEAQEMSQTLFDDAYLSPLLTFVSPSGLGVKAFVPYTLVCNDNPAENATKNMCWAMQYIELAYGNPNESTGKHETKIVDTSGKDIVRSCFLCHDPHALMRKKETFKQTFQ